MRGKIFASVALMAAMALSGCSDPAAYHVGEAERQAMAPLTVTAQPAADAGFCRNVAHQDAAGLEAGTGNRFYKVSFVQCMAAFGPPALRLADLATGDAGY